MHGRAIINLMITFVPTSWGDSLRLARLQRSISQVKLSQLSGVSSWTIHQIERKGIAPSERTKAKLARALSVSVSDLFPSNLPPGGDSLEAAGIGKEQ